MKYTQVTRDWLNFLGRKAEKPLETVSRADAIAYRDHLSKAGLSARTTNQTVKLLRGIYTDAVEQSVLSRNPFAGVHSLRKTSENVHRVPFSNAEVASLVEHTEGDWKGMVILAVTALFGPPDQGASGSSPGEWDHYLLRRKGLANKTAARISVAGPRKPYDTQGGCVRYRVSEVMGL
jgi:hypothetical protein